MDYKIITLLTCICLTSCGGLRTFHDYARAGDTVAIPTGMQPDFNKDNITVTIIPSIGNEVVINSTDPEIRGIINFYPDPVSNMLVSRAIEEDTSAFASTYADALAISSNSDKDWFQTVILLDLPTTLPDGLTQIEVANTLGTTHTATLDVIPGTGVSNKFASDFNDGLELSDAMIDSLARANHTTVTLESSTIPHAVELIFTHDPDKTVGGTGMAFIINPLGYLKNINWSDDGTNMKVIMMQSKDGIITDINDYKFYISGTANNLQLVSISGFDIYGDEISEINASLTQN